MIVESLQRLAEVERPANPFPGLRPFEFHENHLFFGREGQSEQLIATLGHTRFVCVVGTSGSGKSSLVRAGFLPALYGGLMAAAGSGWRCAIMRPGHDPIGNLARALCAPDVFGSGDPAQAAVQIAITEATLRRGSLGLIEAVRQAHLPADKNLLVLADQFEELFRIEPGDHDKQDEKAAFVKLLLEAKDRQEPPIYIVLTMRSDYLGDCAQFWDLPEAINQGQYLIPRMTREQRRIAITGPVAVGGAAITPRLLNRLLNDAGDNPDQLPILQHALMRTWVQWEAKDRGNGPLDLPHFEAVGGLSDALSRHADEAYDELLESRQTLAEKIFRSLTEKGSDNREVRRPLTVGDICGVTAAEGSEVIAVIEAFRHPDRSFLTPGAEHALTPDSLIDISHESLIRNWQRLKAWVDDEAQSAAIYRRLAETAALHGEGEAGLWRDPDLQVALAWRERAAPNEAWARRYHPGFAAAMGFLEHSLAAREAEARDKDQRRRLELKRARTFAVVLGLAFLMSAGFALYGFQKRSEALVQKNTAVHQRGIAEQREKANRLLAYVANISLASEAFSEGYPARANELLNAFLPARVPREDMRTFGWYYLWRLYHNEKATLTGHGSWVSCVAFAPDGKTLASGGWDATVKLWDPATAQLIATLAGDAGKVSSVAFAPDGQTLAAGHTDGTVKLWSVNGRQQLATLKGHSKWITSVVFAPDGRMLASGARDGKVKLWNLDTYREQAAITGRGEWIYSVAFAPDGKTLASGSDDGTVQLWDTATRQLLATLKGQPDGVYSVAFAPDGRMLSAGGADGSVGLWDLNTRQDLATFQAHTGGTLSVVFGPDSKTLASVSEDGTVKLWNALTGKALTTLSGHADWVSSVAFAPDGRTLASASGDGTVKLWAVGEPQRPISLLEGHTADIHAVAFAPDGETLASGSADGTVRLWEVETRRVQATLTGHAGDIYAVAFAPDGATLASGSGDGTVKLWDTKTRQTLADLDGQAGEVSSVAFSPGGETLAAGSWEGSVKLWNVRTQQVLTTLEGHEYGVSAVQFAPDGKTLAAGSYGGAISLWDLGNGKLLASLEGHAGDVYAVAFAPGGKTLASGSRDNTIRLWDVQTGDEMGALKGHANSVSSVAFGPDGETLASGSDDGTVKLWHIGSRQALVALKDHAGRVHSVAFSSDGKTLASGSADKSVRLYSAATKQEVERQLAR